MTDDRILSKIVYFLVAVWVSIIALTAGLVAHYLFGASVQTSASIGAAIFAVLVAIGWFLQNPDDPTSKTNSNHRAKTSPEKSQSIG